VDDYLLNKRQARALAQLERAFAACSRAGLAMHGMGDRLLVVPIRQAIREGADVDMADHAIWQRGTSVDTEGVYVDSGGF